MEKAIFVLSIFIQASFVITFFIFLFIATYGKTIMLSAVPSILCAGLILGFVFYKGYKTRQITYFSTTFIIIGIILILFGSLIEVPYSTWQSYRKDVSRDRTISLRCPSEDRPIYDNWSVRKVTFPPLSEKKYRWQYYSYSTLNNSIIQIDIDTSGSLIFKIAELEDYIPFDVQTILFNRTMHSGWFEDDISLDNDDWITYFWTTPTLLSNYVGFVFENPSNRSIVFSFRVTEYFLKSTDKEEVINYQTLVDPFFAYGGIALIGASILLEVYSLRKKKQVKAIP